MQRAIVLSILIALAPLARAGEPARDLHDYWDTRCRSCHGEAGSFARGTLGVEQGQLVGKHHRADLQKFLHNHYLTDELVTPVMAMLAAQATTTPLFITHCAGCHGRASDFARQSLVLQAGVLTGKASRRPVADYLRTHGGLRTEQEPTMVDTLRRVLGEVGG